MLTHYPRMRYRGDQRDWVKRADADLPGALAMAALAQKAAAELYANWDSADMRQRERYYKTFLPILQESYDDAIKALYRVLYLEGMRRANLPEEEAE